MKKAPSAFGTSPKYDDSNSESLCKFSIVGFGGGGWGHALRELQSASGEELSALSPSGRYAVPSALRPQGGAFKGEL